MPPAADPPPEMADRVAALAEMDQVREDFRDLIARASRADLRRPSDGTRWTNQQLLFHMLLGYLVVRALLPLVRLFGRLPGRAGAAFAGLLNAARGPFHVINYLGSCAGGRLIRPARLPGMLDHVITALQRRLQQQSCTALKHGMHYPTSWDPYFTGWMTLAELYRYPTRHYRHHRQQLTIRDTTSRTRPHARNEHRPGRKAGTLAVMGLTSAQARRFYDRLGRGQDWQAFYEDRAVSELLARGRLDRARAVFEFGCGTGRLAARLLGQRLPAGARYLGADISGTMTSLSKARLGRFGDRAAVIQADGTAPLPLAGGAFDRFLAIYVLDLLGPAETAAIIAEARRVLRPGGLLGVVSLTHGATTPARLVCRAWTAVWSRAPVLTGGCRPVSVLPLLDGWQIEHRAQATAWALTSEVVVARR